MPNALDLLRTTVADVKARSRVPFSSRADAAVVLLSDGTWVPGVRVESASFSLTIPSLQNAVTTAQAAGRSDVVAAVLSRPLSRGEAAYLAELPEAPLDQVAADVCTTVPVGGLPAPGAALDPFLTEPLPSTPADGIRLARRVAERAFVPASAFPVGCVLVSGAGHLVPGCNVEHPDWSHILCAERNALGTAVTFGIPPITAGYLTCLRDADGTPCGACRQLLVELAPDATLWMDRSPRPPQSSPTPALLPGSFRGRVLFRS